MNRRSILTLVSASLALATIGTVVAVPLAAPYFKAPPTAVIATVDLESVVNSLTEKTARETELKAYADSLQAELSKMGSEIESIRGKLDLADAADKRVLGTQLAEKNINAKVKKEFFEALIDQRRSEIFKGLYTRISDASAKLAARNGYTLVLSSDMGIKIPNGPSNEVERTITLKRFLYIAKEHDITNELVAMMNNEWAAGGGK